MNRHLQSMGHWAFCGLTCLSLLPSCGYRWEQGTTVVSERSLSIPYVKGDGDGELTTALIGAIARSGIFRYSPEGGELILQVTVLDYLSDNVGFCYDSNRKGCLTSSIIPNETRVTAWVELSLSEAATGRVLLGPVRLSADVEFDHDYYSSRNAVNVFSLGQFTDMDEAYDAAQRPLNRNLAYKIVDYLRDAPEKKTYSPSDIEAVP
jgi:hypothetical protein